MHAALLAISVTAGACVGRLEPPVFSGGACLWGAAPGSVGAQTVPTLVDRADAVVLATVVRAEPYPNTGPRFDDQSARRVTLKVLETATGSVAQDLVIDDRPCPLLGAQTGESLVVFLEGTAPPKPIGLPTSALRAKPGRSLAQLMTEIRAVRSLDGEAKALFERYAWTVTGKYAFDEFAIPASSEFALAGRELRTLGARLTEPFERYAALSVDAGLDLRSHAGKNAELMTFSLDTKRENVNTPGMSLGHALVVDRRIVGAWVSAWAGGGTFSVRDRAGAHAAPAQIQPAAPSNRVPQGINVARAYDLASARRISFKTGAGAGADITDPAKIRAFAAALDVLLPTEQLIWDDQTPPSRYYFYIDFPGWYVALLYDAADGTVVVYRDGFRAKAPEAFATLVRALP